MTNAIGDRRPGAPASAAENAHGTDFATLEAHLSVAPKEIRVSRSVPSFVMLAIPMIGPFLYMALTAAPVFTRSYDGVPFPVALGIRITVSALMFAVGLLTVIVVGTAAEHLRRDAFTLVFDAEALTVRRVTGDIRIPWVDLRRIRREVPGWSRRSTLTLETEAAAVRFAPPSTELLRVLGHVEARAPRSVVEEFLNADARDGSESLRRVFESEGVVDLPCRSRALLFAIVASSFTAIALGFLTGLAAHDGPNGLVLFVRVERAIGPVMVAAPLMQLLATHYLARSYRLASDYVEVHELGWSRRVALDTSTRVARTWYGGWAVEREGMRIVIVPWVRGRVFVEHRLRPFLGASASVGGRGSATPTA